MEAAAGGTRQASSLKHDCFWWLTVAWRASRLCEMTGNPALLPPDSNGTKPVDPIAEKAIELRLPHFVVFIAGVSTLAFLPAFLPLRPGQFIAYDPALAVNVVTLLTVAAYTYLTYGLLRHTKSAAEAERSRRRDALAVALLVEFVVLEDKLRCLHADASDEYAMTLQTPVLQNAVRNIDLFEPAVAYALVRLSQVVSAEARRLEELRSIRAFGGSPVLGVVESNQIVFDLTLLRLAAELLRPFAPLINSPWLTFPVHRTDALPLPSAIFADIAEVECGADIPVAGSV